MGAGRRRAASASSGSRSRSGERRGASWGEWGWGEVRVSGDRGHIGQGGAGWAGLVGPEASWVMAQLARGGSVFISVLFLSFFILSFFFIFFSVFF